MVEIMPGHKLYYHLALYNSLVAALRDAILVCISFGELRFAQDMQNGPQK